MSQTITLNWTQDDAKTTRHEILVSIDGGAESSLGFFDIAVLTTTYEAAEGHVYTFYADPYSVDVKGTRATINSVVVPEIIKKFNTAELSDAGDWTQEGITPSWYATGGGDGTATYTFDLTQLSGWSSGEDVDVYVKTGDVTGDESTVTKVVVTESSALFDGTINQSTMAKNQYVSVTTVTPTENTLTVTISAEGSASEKVVVADNVGITLTTP